MFGPASLILLITHLNHHVVLPSIYYVIIKSKYASTVYTYAHAQIHGYNY